MKILKSIKKRLGALNFYKRYQEEKDRNLDIAEIRQHQREIKSDIHKLMLYKKAQMALKDNVFNFLFEDKIIKFYLPYALSDYIQSYILDSGNFLELNLLSKMRKYITTESVVLDAGANIGNHTVFFSKICNAKKVISFEPQKHLFNILEKNLELNDIVNAEKYDLALGEKEGSAQISDFDNTTCGSTQFSFTEDGDFKVISLDSLNLEQLDFCKIDVEGAQLEVLKGAKNTLETFKPIIWIELLNEESAIFNYNIDKEIILPQKFLEDLGYVMVEKMSNYDYLYIHKNNIK